MMSERSERYIYNISVYSYSLATKSLASLVHSYGVDACLTPIYLFMVWVAFSLPYIVCYRWREFGGITTVGSYSGLRLHTMGAMYNIVHSLQPSSPFLSFLFHLFERFHHDIMILCFYGIILLVFEYTSTTISPIMSERSERFIYNIPVHSYLRSFLTATFFAIFYSFRFMCSRDFIIIQISI